jgi:hypothetical protein
MSKEDWKLNTIDFIFGEYYPKNVVSILDLGCGISCKSQYLDATYRVGVDIYEPYLDEVQDTFPGMLIKHDIRKIDDIFTPKSFDLILLLDVIEHLEKQEALDLMIKCESIAKKAIIIETPLGLVPQNIDILGFGGHEWQTHRSGWTKEILMKLGYVCLLRDYKMTDVKRHTDIDVDVNVRLIDAIKLL